MIHGLQEMVIERRRGRQAFLAVAGDGDEPARRQLGDASQLRRHFDPAHAGQREVEEHDIRPIELRRLDRRRAIEGDAGLMALAA